MKAMILAAGYGHRLQPLTFQVPKPAIPVLGRPLIQQVLSSMGGQGCREATVNLHHLPDVVATLLAETRACGLERLHISLENNEILGTGGGIRNAADYLRGDGTFLVRNSDFLLDIDLQDALKFHRRSGRLATLVLAGPRNGYTPVPVDRDNRILSFGDLREYDRSEQVAEGTFTGLHIVEEEILDRIPGPGPCDIVQDVYLPMLAEGTVGAYITDRFWWEFGSPEQYLEGSLHLIDLKTADAKRFSSTDPVKNCRSARVALGPGAVVEPNTVLKGRVAVGMAAALADNSMVEDSVVMSEAWIGAGARLTRCIIGPKVEIPAGQVLNGKMVCTWSDEHPLPPGCELSGNLAFRPIDG